MSRGKELVLHFAQHNDEESIPTFVFDDLDELIGFILAESNTNKVYLISVFNEVFVSCNMTSIIGSTEYLIDNIFEFLREDIKSIDIFYQEYDSYEDAYKVALDMQEVKQLAYKQ